MSVERAQTAGVRPNGPLAVVLVQIVTISAGVIGAHRNQPDVAWLLPLLSLCGLSFVVTFLMVPTHPKASHRSKYLLGQTVAGLLAVALSQGSAALVLMPLAGEYGRLLPKRRARLYSLLLGLWMFAWLATYDAPWGEIVAAALGLGAGLAFVAAFVELQVEADRARARSEALADELHRAHQQLEASVRAREALAVSQARIRFAREIHDGLGHAFTSARIHLRVLRRLWPDPESRAAHSLGALEQALDSGLAEVRHAVSMLGPALPNRNLSEVMLSLVEAADSEELEVRLQEFGALPDMPQPVVDCVHRLAQECITNTQKHAGAQHLCLQLNYGDGQLRFSAEDNGPGGGEICPGHGLNGMRARVEAQGGRLSWHREGGFRVQAELPI